MTDCEKPEPDEIAPPPFIGGELQMTADAEVIPGEPTDPENDEEDR